MKVAFQTYGCSNNVAETEAMTGLLNEEGYSITKDKDDADVIVMNMCTVKGDAKALNEIKNHTEQFPGKKFVFTGCIPDYAIKKVREIVPHASVITTHNIDKIGDAVRTTGNGFITLRKRTELIKSDLPAVKINPLVGIIPICSGCTSHCTYCSTKLVKGNLVSYPVNSIKKKTKELIEKGTKELWLTSQDNGDYGRDIGTNPAVLLNEISGLEGECMIRFGMTNPMRVKEYLSDLVAAYKHDKVYKFLHIPVQSGNDEILRLMNRRYSVDEFKKIITEFRKEIPEMNISTDVICGFPEETEAQFDDTVALIQEMKPDSLNISRFAPRPGTKAFRMKQVHGRISKERSRKLTTAFLPIERENNKRWIGWKGTVLITEKGKNNTWVGKNYAYKQVVIESDENLLGKKIRVHAVDAGQHDVKAVLL